MPKLQQKQPTKPLADRTLDVLDAMSILEHMPNYPKTERAIRFTAGILAKFIETVEVNHFLPDEPDHPAALGWVNPLDWVVAEIGATFYSFPAPIKWREVYETRFTPLDGRRSADMLAVVE